jgi:outer membrane protein TolC
VLDLATADYNDRVVGAVREAADAVARIGALSADRARQREVVRGYAETGRLNAIRVSSGLDSRLDLVDNDVRTLAAEQADADLAADAAQQRVQLVLRCSTSCWRRPSRRPMMRMSRATSSRSPRAIRGR